MIVLIKAAGIAQRSCCLGVCRWYPMDIVPAVLASHAASADAVVVLNLSDRESIRNKATSPPTQSGVCLQRHLMHT